MLLVPADVEEGLAELPVLGAAAVRVRVPPPAQYQHSNITGQTMALLLDGN